ncbi:MAG: alpha/beta hydrolase [Zetaproteobacteria bacterium]|nr:alpha/beta hydrolase [Zetaproteobacteria bacterium]
MPFVDTKRGKIYFRLRGQGPAILLLHGIERTSDNWGSFPKELAKEHTVIVMDHRGSGQSSAQMKWSDRIEDLAEDAAIVMQESQITTYGVFGLSLGGMVALALAHKFPQRVEYLVVANTSVKGLGCMRLTPTATLLTMGTHLTPWLNTAVIAILCSAKSSSWNQRIALWQDLQSKIRRFGWERETTTKYLLAALRFELPEFKSICPTLLLTGAEDRFVSPQNTHKILKTLQEQGHRHCLSLVTLERGGHELGFEHSKLVHEKVEQFIGSNLHPLNRQKYSI